MTCYRIFNRLVNSDLCFPGLKPLSGQKGEYEFRLSTESYPTSQLVDWVHEWKSEESVWALLGNCGQDFLIRFPQFADFLISSDRRRIHCYANHEITPETISHLFLDQVFPCLLGQEDSVVLHASAVMVSSGAVMFIGESGSGKSTLSASLSSSGFPLMADDSLLLHEYEGEFLCVPSYPGVRLWPESVSGLFGSEVGGTPMAHYSAKQRLNCDQNLLEFADGAVPLRKIYFLDESEPETQIVRVVPTKLRDAYLELLKHVFRLDASEWTRTREEFRLVAKIVEAVKPLRLSYPRNFLRLPEVRQALLNDLGEN